MHFVASLSPHTQYMFIEYDTYPPLFKDTMVNNGYFSVIIHHKLKIYSFEEANCF